MKLCIVVPCFNEEATLPETTCRLLGLLRDLQAKNKIDRLSELVFVDDGSMDSTWTLIEQLARDHENVHGRKLSRNRGHQNALLAGLFSTDGDAVITIDADLQDDIVAIEQMVDGYHAGYDIVYGVRSGREADTALKRVTAEAYYRALVLMGVDLVFNHADFRLLSRRAIRALSEYGEVNLFLRGIIPQLGFPSTVVRYERQRRLAGETKYSLRKMFSLAIEGVTSFSAFPLRVVTVLGITVFAISVLLGLWAVAIKLFTAQAVPGWASTVIPAYLLGGVQLLGIGIIGEYLAKIYLETKRRPRSHIEKSI
jgi:polyisoprenyl-phosphate glycosyltransferase